MACWLTYPDRVGQPAITNQIGPVQGLPTTYLFNPEGKMVAQQVGPITRQAVESYLASKKAPSQKIICV